MKFNTLSPELLRNMDAFWRAANYLSVGQIYLYDKLLDHQSHIEWHGEDMLETRDWKWEG